MWGALVCIWVGGFIYSVLFHALTFEFAQRVSRPPSGAGARPTNRMRFARTTPPRRHAAAAAAPAHRTSGINWIAQKSSEYMVNYRNVRRMDGRATRNRRKLLPSDAHSAIYAQEYLPMEAGAGASAMRMICPRRGAGQMAFLRVQLLPLLLQERREKYPNAKSAFLAA